MPGREPPGGLAACADILRPRAPWATFLDPVACGTAWPPSAQPPVPVRPRWATGWAASTVPSAGWFPTEVGSVSGMRKKVIPFPPRKAARSRPVTQGSRIMIHVSAQRYVLNVPCQAMGVPPEPALAATPNRLEELPVHTRFLRLREPAGLGDERMRQGLVPVGLVAGVGATSGCLCAIG